MKYLSSLFGGILLTGVLIGTSRSAHADKAGDALFDKCLKTEAALQTLQADFTMETRTGAQISTTKGKFQLKKPNLAHITLANTSGSYIANSNGRKLVTFFSNGLQYASESSDPGGGNVTRQTPLESVAFYNPDMLDRYRSLGTGVKIVADATIGGVRCKVAQLVGTRGITYRFYISPDGLLRGANILSGKGVGRTTIESRLTNLKANAPLAPAVFAWTPPKNSKPVPMLAMDPTPTGNGGGGGLTDNGDSMNGSSSLLAVGKTAPDFELALANGNGKVKLSSVVKSNKATLLNFWALFCGPCREELPHLNKILASLKSKGFDILTVNSGDDAKSVMRFWTANNLTMQVAVGGEKIAELYHVEAIPTNYVIGSDGKILGSFEGFDEAGIRAALAKAGIK